MSNSGKLIAALATGVAAGVILGVLLAPGKGSETRKKLKEKGKKFADEVKETIKKGKEKFSGLQDDIEQNIKQKMSDLA